ncbi:MAG: hypothetical protein ACJ79K_03200 [Gemmatimonadaceae bacterium]
MLLAYRLAKGAPNEAFHLRGLAPGTTYDVLVDGAPQPAASGAQLATAGLRLALGDEWRAAVIEIILRR